MKATVFLDRDGMSEDVHLLTRPDQVLIPPGVPGALKALAAAGFKLVVVSNQPWVARGRATEQEVRAVPVQTQPVV
jgi:D-glycero-D-manno-heptose 1,7-bisphosphate phosphatase